jgi:hypothetical protein
LRAGHGPERLDCLAGAAGLEPPNGVANYPFEMSHEFSGDSAKLRYQRLFAEELRIAETLGDVTAWLAYRTQAGLWLDSGTVGVSGGICLWTAPYRPPREGAR